jgi:hypothetical protein
MAPVDIIMNLKFPWKTASSLKQRLLKFVFVAYLPWDRERRFSSVVGPCEYGNELSGTAEDRQYLD